MILHFSERLRFVFFFLIYHCDQRFCNPAISGNEEIQFGTTNSQRINLALEMAPLWWTLNLWPDLFETLRLTVASNFVFVSGARLVTSHTHCSTLWRISGLSGTSLPRMMVCWLIGNGWRQSVPLKRVSIWSSFEPRRFNGSNVRRKVIMIKLLLPNLRASDNIAFHWHC